MLMWAPKHKLALCIALKSPSVKYWPVPAGSATLLWFLQTAAKRAKKQQFCAFFCRFLNFFERPGKLGAAGGPINQNLISG